MGGRGGGGGGGGVIVLLLEREEGGRAPCRGVAAGPTAAAYDFFCGGRQSGVVPRARRGGGAGRAAPPGTHEPAPVGVVLLLGDGHHDADGLVREPVEHGVALAVALGLPHEVLVVAVVLGDLRRGGGRRQPPAPAPEAGGGRPSSPLTLLCTAASHGSGPAGSSPRSSVCATEAGGEWRVSHSFLPAPPATTPKPASFFSARAPGNGAPALGPMGGRGQGGG